MSYFGSLVSSGCLVAGLLLTTFVSTANASGQNILMMAGPPSHGYGSHEHYAGLKILEESLRASDDQLKVTVVRGWPDDASLVEKA